MKKFDKDKLAELDIYLGEPNEQVREGLRAMLRSEGLRRTRTFTRMDDLMNAMKERSPDLLIVADDVVIKPLDPKKIHERLRLITYHRQPFVATSEYVGPDRKSDKVSHPGARRVNVLNTMREKADGRKFEPWELKEAITDSLSAVVEAQLTSQSMKMGQLCDVILDAHKIGHITEELRDNFIALKAILREAANMAQTLKDNSLESLCLSLAENVAMMEINYESLEDGDIDLIQKLSQAFRMAIDSAAQRKQNEEEELTAKYDGRIAGNSVDI